MNITNLLEAIVKQPTEAQKRANFLKRIYKDVPVNEAVKYFIEKKYPELLTLSAEKYVDYFKKKDTDDEWGHWTDRRKPSTTHWPLMLDYRTSFRNYYFVLTAVTDSYYELKVCSKGKTINIAEGDLNDIKKGLMKFIGYPGVNK